MQHFRAQPDSGFRDRDDPETSAIPSSRFQTPRADPVQLERRAGLQVHQHESLGNVARDDVGTRAKQRRGFTMNDANCTMEAVVNEEALRARFDVVAIDGGRDPDRPRRWRRVPTESNRVRDLDGGPRREIDR